MARHLQSPVLCFLPAAAIKCCFLLLLLLHGAGFVSGYIPAHPTNSTNSAIANGLNMTDVSRLFLQWFPNGSYTGTVSYQLARSGSDGVAKGALVHFSETSVNNDTEGTITPWVALVSCDANATQASNEIDIFTLARDKGAVAAVLYSLKSAACIINPRYTEPQFFDKIMDIYSVQNLSSANLLEYQFGQLAQNATLYRDYNSSRLNDSYVDVTQSISLGFPVAAGYLISSLIAYNATRDGNIDGSASDGASVGSGGSSQNTAVAMIILYTITGCVSLLFLLVIISGAIRAIRHPERYGPRAGSRWSRDQSRAQGLTRAILDTFPIVKFGSSPPTLSSKRADMEGRDPPTEMITTETSLPRPLNMPPDNHQRDRLSDDYSQESSPAGPSSHHNVLSTFSREASSHTSNTGAESLEPERRQSREDVVPEAMGTETCPICIVDFQEGDNLRVLPCEGHHRFHQACVDPWLLELSSACPICRHDFLALENIIAGESDDESSSEEDSDGHNRYGQPVSPTSDTGGEQPRANRFSRYLHFARRRHIRRSEREGNMDNGGQPAPSDVLP